MARGNFRGQFIPLSFDSPFSAVIFPHYEPIHLRNSNPSPRNEFAGEYLPHGM